MVSSELLVWAPLLTAWEAVELLLSPEEGATSTSEHGKGTWKLCYTQHKIIGLSVYPE